MVVTVTRAIDEHAVHRRGEIGIVVQRPDVPFERGSFACELEQIRIERLGEQDRITHEEKLACART